jgi:uncharacterized membrane protein
VYVLAFVTSSWRFRGSDGMEREFISVYLPTTPNPTSGMMLIVPRSETTASDLSIEDAMKMVISGGAVGPEAHRAGEGVRGSSHIT